MNTDEITKIIQASTEGISETIKAGMSQYMDIACKSMIETIAAEVNVKVRKYAAENLRSPALFEYSGNRHECPWKGQIQPLSGEYIFMSWTDITTWSNYGRVVVKDFAGYQQTRNPDIALTAEVMVYIRAICMNTQQSSASIVREKTYKVLDKYAEKYAFTHNSIHDAEVKAIEAKIRTELSQEFLGLVDERTRLKALESNLQASIQQNERQAAILKADREEFEVVAAKEKGRKRSERELDTSKRQIVLLKKQLSRVIGNVKEQKELFQHDQEQWEHLRKTLVDCKSLLSDINSEDD